jgi:squalene cyclase
MLDVAERAARSGVDFLLDNQGNDGMWRDFITPAGEASCWPTGVALTALRAVGADHARLARATGALVARQRSDGGWGYNEQTPSDADSTSWVLLALASDAFACGQTWARGAAFLRQHRRRNGGIATYAKAGPIRRYTSLPRWLPFSGWCRPTVEVSATATRALRAIAPPMPSEMGWHYIQSQQRADGSWGAYWWTTPHLATQQAVMLGALVGDADTIGPAAVWANRVLHTDAPAFSTALCLSILATVRPQDRDTINNAIDMVQRLQLVDGSWPSVPILRIPVPADTTTSDHRGWQLIRFAGGIEVADQHRIFTTAICVGALVQATKALTGAHL